MGGNEDTGIGLSQSASPCLFFFVHTSVWCIPFEFEWFLWHKNNCDIFIPSLIIALAILIAVTQ